MDADINFDDIPVVTLNKGDVLLKQGGSSSGIYFLKDGKVSVIKDGHEVAKISDKQAVFGEMSIMLDIGHSASVECLENSSFHYLDNPQEYLKSHPSLLWHITQLVSMRLFNLNQYLVDIKNQYEGHDHLSMVDDVLETLLNQQKTKVLKRGVSKRDAPDY